MSVQLRFVQGSAGPWAQAFIGTAGSEVTVEGQATEATVIASWRIEVLYAHDHDTITPTPSTPVVLAENSDSASPSGSFTPPRPGAYLIRLTTWPQASFSGAPEHDYREFRAGFTRLGDCAPAPVTVASWQTAILAQEAAGRGRHDNFGGFAFGWGGDADGPGLARVYEIVERLESLREPVIVSFDATPNVTQAAEMVYAGADENVVLAAGEGPHVPGAVLSILFPQGTINDPNAVSIGADLHPSGASFDPAYDFRVNIFALRTDYLVCSANLEPPTDAAAPTVQSATVADTDRDAIVVVFNESVTITDASGWSLSGVALTVTGVSGSGTIWTLALSGEVVPADSITLNWDGTNTVEDASGNSLEAGSESVVNETAYPTISSAATNDAGDALTVTFSEAVTASGVTGLSLSGTSAAFDSVTSGSGTDTVVFALSPSVQSGEAVTMDVASTNDIDDLSGLALQATTGQSVTNNVASSDLSFSADILFGYDYSDVSGTIVADTYGPGTYDAELYGTTPPTVTESPPAPLTTNALEVIRANSGRLRTDVGGELPRGQADWAICYCIYFTTYDAGTLYSLTDGDNPTTVFYHYKDDSDLLRAQIDNFAADFTVASPFVQGQWHMVILQRISGVVYLYVDDMTEGNHIVMDDWSGTDVPGTAGTDRFHIYGSRTGSNEPDAYGGPWMLVNRGLSQAEREELHTTWLPT